LRRGCGWPPLALVSAGRDADDPLEVPGQMGLISKAGLGSDRGGRRARVEQRAGAAHPQLVEVGIRWQPGLVTEGAQQRERAESRLARQIIETWRVGEPPGEQLPDVPDGARRAARAPECLTRPGRVSVSGKQQRKRRAQQARGCQPIAASPPGWAWAPSADTPGRCSLPGR
jgi:hypothetical protein